MKSKCVGVDEVVFTAPQLEKNSHKQSYTK